MLQFPESMSAQSFLDRCWQKMPLFLPQALAGDLPALDGDELAWLATLDDVESRLVYTHQQGKRTRYRVEHGPFDEETLGALPAANWTLLVQDVEKHLPELRRYLLETSFIPDWRMDDLMVSFAAPGGSVGPHRDNYDVFLCQGSGRRQWRIAPRDATLKTVQSGGLSLLEPFADDHPTSAGHGDVLYLPPGIAHWGVASEACVTYSIGMRAPRASEFSAALGVEDGTECESGDDERFYVDPDLRIDESEPGLISARAIARVRSCFFAASGLDDEELVRHFGCLVTEVKRWLAPETPSAAEADALLQSAATIAGVRVHGMARLAFYHSGGHGRVFVNGRSAAASAAQIEVFRRLCASRRLPAGELRAAAKNAASAELVRWLAANGAFDLSSDPESEAS